MSVTTQERLAGRRDRLGRIRRTAIASALATFATAWAIIFFQLVSGHDPALGTGSSSSAAATSSAPVQASGSYTPESEYSYPAQDDYYAPPASVTTRQS
jgi:hypothetical protein